MLTDAGLAAHAAASLAFSEANARFVGALAADEEEARVISAGSVGPRPSRGNASPPMPPTRPPTPAMKEMPVVTASRKLRVGSIFSWSWRWLGLPAARPLRRLVGTVAPSATVGLHSAPPTPGATAAGGFQADVDAMLQARDTIHPDGWFGMDRAEWLAAAEEVAGRADTLSDDQRLVELVRLAAMPTWNGRDGHSGIWPFGPDDGTHLYPVRWWRFPEGLVITAARAPYEDLVGARVEAIGDRPIDEVLTLVQPLSPRDNPSNLLAFSTLFLRASELLAGLGVIDEAGPTRFTVVGRDGVGAR